MADMAEELEEFAIAESDLPLELDQLDSNFPAGIYEIETEKVDYEVVLNPILGYVGALIIDEVKGRVDFSDDSVKQLSLVSMIVRVGENAEMVTQDQDLELKFRKTAVVTHIRLLKLI